MDPKLDPSRLNAIALAKDAADGMAREHLKRASELLAEEHRLSWEIAQLERLPPMQGETGRRNRERIAELSALRSRVAEWPRNTARPMPRVKMQRSIVTLPLSCSRGALTS